MGTSSCRGVREPIIETPPESAAPATLRHGSSSPSRLIQLPVGRERRAAPNARTIQADAAGFWEQLKAKRGIPWRRLFLRNYQTLRATALGFGRLGVAVFAVDLQKRTLAGSVCLAAALGKPRVAIVGRHGLADLYLEDDDTLSLRHLAVILHGAKSWDADRQTVSLVDLRSALRFTGENGEPLEAVEATGPVLVQCGRFALFVLTIGDATSWPVSGEDAWDMLPERQYDYAAAPHIHGDPRRHLWAADAAAMGHQVGPGQQQGTVAKPFADPLADPLQERHRAQDWCGKSHITLMDGPQMAQALWLGNGEQALGHLTIASPTTARTMPVSRRALEHGVLIGRDERCDQHELLTDPYISRVHVMLRWIGGRLFAMDLASTGRTFSWHSGRLVPVRLVPVDAPLSLNLAKGRAQVIWHPLSLH
jgi:FHA domain